MRANKRLGQSFLKDSAVLERIAAVLQITQEDTLIEIGPGHGELTRRLLRHEPHKVVGIEKDPRMVDYYLKALATEHPNLEIFEGDALEELPRISKKLSVGYKLVGNIPYYITGALLRLLGELEERPTIAVLTLQKEVAERLTAGPPKMNLLAASVGFWANTEIVRYISRKSFKPSPKVDSAVVKIVPKSDQPPAQQSINYYKTVHVLFNQPRKTIWNNLKTLGLEKDALISMGIEPKLRPQNLTITQIEQISDLFTE